jgi:hypothetical protein
LLRDGDEFIESGVFKRMVGFLSGDSMEKVVEKIRELIAVVYAIGVHIRGVPEGKGKGMWCGRDESLKHGFVVCESNGCIVDEVGVVGIVFRDDGNQGIAGGNGVCEECPLMDTGGTSQCGRWKIDGAAKRVKEVGEALGYGPFLLREGEIDGTDFVDVKGKHIAGAGKEPIGIEAEGV